MRIKYPATAAAVIVLLGALALHFRTAQAVGATAPAAGPAAPSKGASAKTSANRIEATWLTRRKAGEY